MANHLSLPTPSSALSPGVKKLICLLNKPAEIPQDVTAVTFSDVLTEAGNINFTYLEQNLPLFTVLDETAEYFVKATQVICPICTRCQQHLQSYNLDDFVKQYSRFLQWTGNEKDCFELVVSGSDSDGLLGILLVTSALERALGDVFLLRGQQCPSMLKDLLVTQELEQMFGTVVMQTLRIVIGPPISLNLRNLVWHGFPRPAEIPPGLAWFLLLLVPSLGEILEQHRVETHHIVHRPAITFLQSTQLEKQFPSCESTVMEIESVFCESDFVQDEFIPVWKQLLEFYKTERFGFCLVLLLPQLEHALRRVFAAVNGCPERILTAESSTLYTTFDEILDKYLPSGEENKMASLIGEACMELMFDMLVYPDGPRVRDRLSHGEVSLSSVPASLIHPFVCLSVFLCLKFTTTIYQDSVLDKAVLKISGYRSLFHPIAILKTQVSRLLFFSTASSPWIANTPQINKWNTGDDCDKFLEENQIYVQIKTSVLYVVKELTKQFNFDVSFSDLTEKMLSPFNADVGCVSKILEQKTNTLYRGQQISASAVSQTSDQSVRETEIVNLLLHITRECHDVMSQVSDTLITRQHQLDHKQLRSRQRENLNKLINSIPSLYLMNQLNILLITFHIGCLDNMTTANQYTLKKVQRFLKMYLQFCENERTNTAPDRNKWKECLDLFTQFLPKALTYLTGCQLVFQ